MNSSMREITLRLIACLEFYCKHVKFEDEETLNLISEELITFIRSFENEEDLLVLVLQCFNIFSVIFDSMGLTFDEIKDRVFDPISMEVLIRSDG